MNFNEVERKRGFMAGAFGHTRLPVRSRMAQAGYATSTCLPQAGLSCAPL